MAKCFRRKGTTMNNTSWRNRMMVASFLTFATFAAVSFTVWASPTRQERSEAGKLVNHSVQLNKKQKHDEARKSLEKAISLHDTPRARLLLAETLVKLTLYVEAREHAELVANNSSSPFYQRKTAQKLVKQIDQSVARLTIDLSENVDAIVKVNGLIIDRSGFATPLEVNPGTFKIIAQAAGYKPFEKELILSKGEQTTFTVHLVKDIQDKNMSVRKTERDDQGNSKSSGATIKTLGWVSLGVGAVGLAVGTGFGLASRSTRQDLRDSCVNNVCTEQDRDKFNKGKKQATISTVGFVVGGVGVATGITLFLVAPKNRSIEVSTDSATVRLYMTTQSFGVTGSF